MSVRGKGEAGAPEDGDEDECDPRTASAEAYSAFARRLCARDARCAGARPASVDELWDAVRTMAVHDRRQRLQVMYSAEEIGQPVYGRVAPHPAHWGHAALVGRCTAAVLACAPAAVRAALGRHRVLHRYTAHYDAAAACLIIAVPDDDNGDSNDITLAGALDAPAHVPALRVLAVEPVGGRSAAAPRRVLACPCADPTAAPVTLACTGRLSPLVIPGSTVVVAAAQTRWRQKQDVVAVTGANVAVLHYPSPREHEAARTVACARLPAGSVLRPGVLVRVAGKVRAVQTLVLTRAQGAAPGWAGVALRCVVLVDTFEAVVPVDVSALTPLLHHLLALDDFCAESIVPPGTAVFDCMATDGAAMNEQQRRFVRRVPPVAGAVWWSVPRYCFCGVAGVPLVARLVFEVTASTRHSAPPVLAPPSL